jgi:small subunit ribosomal protein S16
MAVKIRLRQQGRRNAPFYRIVVADERSPRDGKYVECIGWYNPREIKEENSLNVKIERVMHWLQCGAVVSEKTKNLLRKGAKEVMEQHDQKLIEKQDKLRLQRKARRANKANKVKA